MRIGINLLYLRPGAVGGSEVYVRELIRHLPRTGSDEYFVFCSAETAATFAPQAQVTVVTVLTKPFSQVRRLMAENWTLRHHLVERKIDVLLSPANFAAPFLLLQVPQVAVVHDLQHIRLKRYFSRSQRIFRSLMFRLSFFRCRTIIAVSEFTRQDLIERYNLKPEFVVSVPEGVDHHVVPDTDQCLTTRHKFQLPEQFFYYPVALAPHKNHATLIAAFAKFKQHTGVSAQLIFTGMQTALYESIQQQIMQLKLSDSVRHLGYVSRQEVLAIMTMASALVFPSEFEGFGIPLLEAMQCGTPVIASNRASIPEVTSDAALLLEPHDVAAWAEALTRILTDVPLRASLVTRGHANAQRFSWEKCASQTLAVLHQSVKHL